MDRRDIILEYIRKDQRGIEIGPYFNPLVPKASGWKTLVLDVFEARTLRERAANDPNIPGDMISNIEEVDLVGSAHQIGELAATHGLDNVDFIISSHNFEHLPNPIEFLQSCSAVLRPGGTLSMIIPDKRACFDYFRPVSTLGSMLEAYFEKRLRPTSAQIFDHQSLQSHFRSDFGEQCAFSLAVDPHRIMASEIVDEAYRGLCARRAAYSSGEDAPYEDCHCWTFTPDSFQLLMLDLGFLGLIDLVPMKVYGTQGCEFYVHLKNMRAMVKEKLSRRDYYDRRQQLLQAMNADSTAPIKAEAEKAAAALAEAQVELDQMRAVLDATYRSHSWRVTMPLRATVTALRRMRSRRPSRAASRSKRISTV